MKINYYKGMTARGVIKSMEVKNHKIKQGKNKGSNLEILTITIRCGDNNVTAVMRNSLSQPDRIKEIVAAYNVGDSIKATGWLMERPYVTENGDTRVDRKSVLYRIEDIDDKPMKATFTVNGIVSNIRDKDDRKEILVDILDEIKSADGTKSYELNTITLYCDEHKYDELYSEGIENGAFIAVSGSMLNRLITDEYDQVISSERGLRLEKVYKIVEADEVEDCDDYAVYRETKRAAKSGNRYTVKKKSFDNDEDDDIRPRVRKAIAETDEEDY